MPEPRYPTDEEFWRRLRVRGVEADLVAALRERTARQERPVRRLPAATVAAVASRLVPGAVPPEALAVFADEHFDRPVGRGDERAGRLARPDLLPAGFAALDEAALRTHGRDFAALPAAEQDALLAGAERGELDGPAGFDSALWFRRTLALLLLGYGSDPRGMVEMGFPGPSYRSGHVWLDEGEVAARAARQRGYLVL